MAPRSKRKKQTEPSRAPAISLPAPKTNVFPWRALVQAAILVALGAWIYQPALNGLWLWDDDFLIQNNAVVHAPRGLVDIWLNPSTLIDYFPMTVSAEWLEWQIWPDQPFCYHLTSLVLHLLSAMLVWHLFTTLGIRLAWLGALLFVVHPVIVESVAWMAELKNTLAMPPFLFALCLWVDYDRNRRPEYYYAALFLFLIAMLCKSSVVMFPFVILLYAWWKHGRVTGTDLLDSLPFFLISAAVGATLVAYLKHGVGEQFAPLGGLLSRLACAGLSLVFYFSKAVLPVDLLPIYPQWNINPPSPLQFLPWPVLGLGLYWLWSRRQPWSRTALFGLGFFFLNLLPFVGFRFISFMRLTWVMDHFLYVPILGLCGLAAAAAGHIDELLSPATRVWRVGAVVLVLAIFAIGGRHYARIYVNRSAYWAYTVRHNFMAWAAHGNLAKEYLDHKQLADAQREYEIALALNPKYTEAHDSLGVILMYQGRLEEAEAHFREALSYTPEFQYSQAHLKLVQRLEAERK